MKRRLEKCSSVTSELAALLSPGLLWPSTLIRSRIEALGSVSVEVSAETMDSGLWPWPTGVASVPAGTYTLRVFIGNEYCCYNRWLPAETDGLQGCEVSITTTGEDQTIEITDIPTLEDELRVCGVG